MKEHCIYFHYKNDGTVFYVGQSNGLRRPYSKSGRSGLWKKMVKKHGLSVSIIHSLLTKQEANDLEIKYIKQFGRINIKTGTLVNFTDGGDGGLGYVASEETRHKMSESRSGANNPMFGKKFSEETKLKMSIKKLGLGPHPNTLASTIAACTGRIKSASELEKLRASKLGKPRPKWIIDAMANANKRAIIATNQCAIIEYDSMKSIEREFNRDRKTLRGYILSGKEISGFKLYYV